MDPLRERARLPHPPRSSSARAGSASARRRWRRCSATRPRRGTRRRPQPAGCPACRTSPPKAKRVIYLLQGGAPSHVDLFDYKPELDKRRGEELPDVGPHGPAAHAR